ncbi:MAG: DUF4258 domain-containing protein [Methylomicrobium sp.]|nr:DUF4258 domain-containing protein [Methylomicrobium sp.]
MSQFLERIKALVQAGELRISEHGYDELAEDHLTVKEVIAGIRAAVIVEEYPNYPKGPSALFLQKDNAGCSIHVVWGIPQGYEKPAVLITAYRPDPERWNESFMRRR